MSLEKEEVLEDKYFVGPNGEKYYASQEISIPKPSVDPLA